MTICMIKEHTIGININLPRWKALWNEKDAEQTFHSWIDVQQRGAQKSRATLFYKAFIVRVRGEQLLLWLETNLLRVFGREKVQVRLQNRTQKSIHTSSHLIAAVV